MLSTLEYRQKVLGCWMGKNIGGTLGAPFEWQRQINAISFYMQDLGGEPLPNDDLDIQLLWLIALEEKGLDIDAHTLAEYWCWFVTPHWGEYGTAKNNLRIGLHPPLSGIYNNPYKDSCGAFIRSEIWACIAPGNPRLAAQYAFQDAILDHGNGEGTYAEVFCAAMESAAFVESNINELIRIGLTFIPHDCGITQAIHTAINAFERGVTWQEARDEILTHHRGCTPGKFLHYTCKEDQAKGFHLGKLGYDVPSNIAIIVLGLLYGQGDFDKTLCITVNCGEDTDCTGATVGSIFGIINGIDAIAEKWIEPIGRKIKTACLNLGELGVYGNQLPADIDELTERTERLARQLSLHHNGIVAFDGEQEDARDQGDMVLTADDAFCKSLYENMDGATYRFDFFDVLVDYQSDPAIRNGQAKTVKLTFRNTYKIQDHIDIKVHADECWQVTPGKMGKIYAPLANQTEKGWPSLELTFTTDIVPHFVNRFVVELSITGRPTTMLVPIILINNSLTAESQA